MIAFDGGLMDFLICSSMNLSIIFDDFRVTEHVFASMLFLEFIACGTHVRFGCTYREEAKPESTLAAILGKSSGNRALINF